MHLGTALLLLELVSLLVAKISLVFTSAMNVQGEEAEATDTTDAFQRTDELDVRLIVRNAKDLKQANEIFEKLERLSPHPALADNPADPTGSLSAVSFDSATDKRGFRSKHLKPPQSFSPPADANNHRTNVHAPKYMLDLYDKFTKDKYSHPMANIVRSFMNINEEATAVAAEAVAAEAGVVSNSSRMHRLLFNVTSIGRDEEIYLAELRLFTLVEADRQLYDGINRRVTVSEVIGINSSSSSSPNVPEAEGSRRLELIVSKKIYGRHSGWETITVTDAVKRWVKQRPQGDTHMLEVRIETMGRLKDESGSSSSSDATPPPPPPPMFDIDSRPNNENEPLLLVFSNDRRRHLYEPHELNNIFGHDTEGLDTYSDESYFDYTYDGEVEYYDDDGTATERRKRREAAAAAAGAADNIGRLSKSTGRASRGSVDKEPSDLDTTSAVGEMDYPLEIARRLRMASMNETRSAAEEEDNDDDDDDMENGGSYSRHELRKNGGGRRPDGRKRVRRSGKRKLRRNSCHRQPMYVDFTDINWHHWIIRPPGYQAYECTGRCYFPLDDRLTPTKHAIIQTMLHAHYPKKASETCCVPTKLEPISILYFDDQGILTFKYNYDGMVVAECGCR